MIIIFGLFIQIPIIVYIVCEESFIINVYYCYSIIFRIIEGINLIKIIIISNSYY